jgi:hypothetical protein
MITTRAFDSAVVCKYLLTKTSLKHRHFFGGPVTSAQANTVSAMVAVGAALRCTPLQPKNQEQHQVDLAVSAAIAHPPLKQLLMERTPQWFSMLTPKVKGLADLFVSINGKPSNPLTSQSRVDLDHAQNVYTALLEFFGVWADPQALPRASYDQTETELYLTGLAQFVHRLVKLFPKGKRTIRESEAAWAIIKDQAELDLSGFREAPLNALTVSIRPLQRSVADAPTTLRGFKPIAVLLAGTGEGKTLAALLYFANLFREGVVDSLIWTTNTRVAAVSFAARIQETLGQLFGGAFPKVRLGLYGREHDHALWGADMGTLFFSPVVVTTLDQYCKSILDGHDTHMRMTSSLRALVVVDECQGSDLALRTPTQLLLDRRAELRAPSMVMSASIASDHMNEICRLAQGKESNDVPSLILCEPYKDRTHRKLVGLRSRSIEVELRPYTSDTVMAEAAFRETETLQNVIVVRNLGDDVRATFDQADALDQARSDYRKEKPRLFSVRGRDYPVTIPFFSRFAGIDLLSSGKYFGQRFERAPGNDDPCLIVGSRILFDGTNADGDVIYMDLSNADRIIHVLGRLARHRNLRPGVHKLVVYVPPWSREELLDQAKVMAAGKPTHIGQGIGGPLFQDLRAIDAVWEYLEKHRSLDLPNQTVDFMEQCANLSVLSARAKGLGGRWEKHSGWVSNQISKKRLPTHVPASFQDPSISPTRQRAYSVLHFKEGFETLFYDENGRANVVTSMCVSSSLLGKGAGTHETYSAEMVDGRLILRGKRKPLRYERQGYSPEGKQEGDNSDDE